MSVPLFTVPKCASQSAEKHIITTPSSRLPLVPEILLLILGNCDSFKNVIAFASTSRAVYEVWKEDASPILDRLGPQCIAGFDEALIAYRALDLAKSAILDGKLPPKDSDIAQLSGKRRLPQLSEMPGVKGLQRIVEFTEHYFVHTCPLCRDNGWECSHEKRSPDHGSYQSAFPYLPTSEEWTPDCSVFFHRAVYRVLLAGPVLAGWYMEPFTSEGVPNRLPLEFPEHLHSFLEKKNESFDEESHHSCWTACSGEVDLNEEDLSYLEKFIPFDQDSNTRLDEKQDKLFRPLGDWLIQSMKDHISQEDREWAQSCVYKHPGSYRSILEISSRPFLDGLDHDEGIIILRELLRMQSAYESLAHALWNSNNEWGYGRWTFHDKPPVILSDGGCKSPFIIMLGVYQLEQVYFERSELLVTPVGRLPDVRSFGPVAEEAVDIFSLQEHLYATSGRINCIRGKVAAPPRVQLFTFLLHRYFGLSSSGDTWDPPRCNYSPYYTFLLDGVLFTNKREERRNYGADTLSVFPSSPRFSFRRLSFSISG